MIFITLIYIIIYGLLFSFLEIIKRKNILSSDATRRIAHVVSALIACTLPLYLSLTYIIYLAIFFFFALFLSKKVMLLKSIHAVERKTWGEIFFPLAVGITAILLLPEKIHLYQVVILIVGISDTSASLLGTYFPILPFNVFKNKKTISGSIAFFIPTVFILALCNINIFTALGISLLATVVEIFSPDGSDNLTVPLIVSILLLYI